MTAATPNLERIFSAAVSLPGIDPAVIELAQVNVKGFERRSPTGKLEEVRQHTELRRDNWPHPEAVGSHKVLGVFEHPQSPHVLYDLGHGLHAEGRNGKAGPVLRSETGLDKSALREKGWNFRKPPAPGAKPPSAKAGTAVKAPGGKVPLPGKASAPARKPPGPSMPWARRPGGAVEYKDSLGIDRKDMPQLSGLDEGGKYVPSASVIPGFVKGLQARGVKVSSERLPPWALRPTQTTGDFKAIRGIADALKSGDMADTKPIMVSSDHRVLDGHHNWAGRLLADSEGGHPGLKPGMPVVKIGMTADKALAELRKHQESLGIQSRKTGEHANPEFQRPGGAKPGGPLEKVTQAAARGPAKPATKPAAAEKAAAAKVPGKSATGGKLSDAEYRTYADKLDERLTTAAAQHLTSEFTHSPDGGRTWSPDRAKAHDQIVNDLLKKYENVPREGKAIIAGGLGGAGKSTVLKKDPEVAAGKYATVNPDDIKEELAKRGLVPKLPGMPEANPMERTGLVHEESSHVAGLLARKLLAQKTNLVHDITMSSQGSVQKRVDALRGAGYTKIHGMFVHIPVEKSVESARARHREGLNDYWTGKSKLGERFVPSGVIRASARLDGSNANRETFENSKPSFDSWDLWDRSNMGDANLVGSGGNS